MVVCKYYRDGKKSAEGERQRWTFFLHFHPQCWIDQAIAKLKDRVVVETRGRKMIPMDDATRAARWKIMMRRAAVTQRIRREVEKPAEEQSTERIIHLGSMLNSLKEEIEVVGGVPESWK